jgi:hypothetical protein
MGQVWGRKRYVRGFGGEPEGKRPLGRPRLRWEDNIKMDLQEVECEGMDWIELAQDKDRWLELDHLQDPSVDVRIILRWIFRKWSVRV